MSNLDEKTLECYQDVLNPEVKPLEALFRTADLNALIRQQLTNQTINPLIETEAKVQCNLAELCSQAASLILSEGLVLRSEYKAVLRKLNERLIDLYHDLPINPKLRKRQMIGPTGLVMSPDQCIHTIQDDLRVRAFWRAIDKALTERKQQKCIYLLYPACGPFAPLLLPLLSYYKTQGLYSPAQLKIILLDVQQGATESVAAVVRDLELSEFVESIVCADACQYFPPHSIDLLVLEAMQHGLSREGHLAIARHLTKFLSQDGDMLPQQVKVQAVVSQGQQEFIEQWKGQEDLRAENMDPGLLQMRVVLGDVLTINRESLQQLKELHLDQFTTLIEANTITIPQLPVQMKHPLLLLTTELQLYQDEVLREYDSGITHPLPDLCVCIDFVPSESRSGDLLVKSGDRIKFYYRQNGLPGFLPTHEVS
ncbi:hypothetical protein [Rheinheimera sp. KL1]|uniref:hypothetical protein n=1 Tax=Rheinheimera sp. KL1 TaxID=1635005 RepID=UPI0006A9D7AF|nr:hypothetical protein [Rheinheimera sp. KL1]